MSLSWTGTFIFYYVPSSSGKISTKSPGIKTHDFRTTSLQALENLTMSIAYISCTALLVARTLH